MAKHHNPGIKYEYWLPIPTASTSSEEDYSSNEDVSTSRYNLKSVDSVTGRNHGRRRRFVWKIVGFTSCSKTCGGGTQTPILKCIRENPTRVFNSRRCTHLKQPHLHENMMKCNTQPCPAYWKIFEWSDCQCGNAIEEEYKSRDVKCVQELMPGIVIQHNPAACNTDEEPPRREKCDCSIRKPDKNRSKPESILNRPSVHRGKNRKKVEIETKRHGIWLTADWGQEVNYISF